MSKAEEKPYFAPHRPHGWFRPDDRVMFHIPDFEGVLPDKANCFTPGTIIKGYYRPQDVNVIACSDKPFRTNECNDRHNSSFIIVSPWILHNWEFEYLKSHPDYLKIWVRCSKAELHEFDSEAFVAAITKA